VVKLGGLLFVLIVLLVAILIFSFVILYDGGGDSSQDVISGDEEVNDIVERGEEQLKECHIGAPFDCAVRNYNFVTGELSLQLWNLGREDLKIRSISVYRCDISEDSLDIFVGGVNVVSISECGNVNENLFASDFSIRYRGTKGGEWRSANGTLIDKV
jgi:hypothetical protein